MDESLEEPLERIRESWIAACAGSVPPRLDSINLGRPGSWLRTHVALFRFDRDGDLVHHVLGLHVCEFLGRNMVGESLRDSMPGPFGASVLAFLQDAARATGPLYRRFESPWPTIRSFSQIAMPALDREDRLTILSGIDIQPKRLDYQDFVSWCDAAPLADPRRHFQHV